MGLNGDWNESYESEMKMIWILKPTILILRALRTGRGPRGVPSKARVLLVLFHIYDIHRSETGVSKENRGHLLLKHFNNKQDYHIWATPAMWEKITFNLTLLQPAVSEQTSLTSANIIASFLLIFVRLYIQYSFKSIAMEKATIFKTKQY